MEKTKPRTLLICIKTRPQLFSETRELFARLDKGASVGSPIYRLYFENLTVLWRTLTPKRTELMQLLRKQGPMSIRKLATELRRDYKNVHTDIKELLAVDLVKRTKDEKFTVPWDIIDLKIPLAA